MVLKELRETGCWLRMIVKAELLPEERLGQLLDEADQLRKIIGQSINTAKDNRTRDKQCTMADGKCAMENE